MRELRPVTWRQDWSVVGAFIQFSTSPLPFFMKLGCGILLHIFQTIPRSSFAETAERKTNPLSHSSLTSPYFFFPLANWNWHIFSAGNHCIFACFISREKRKQLTCRFRSLYFVTWYLEIVYILFVSPSAMDHLTTVSPKRGRISECYINVSSIWGKVIELLSQPFHEKITFVHPRISVKKNVMFYLSSLWKSETRVCVPHRCHNIFYSTWKW